MANVRAIKEFFEADKGRKVTLAELKELPSEDRENLSTGILDGSYNY